MNANPSTVHPALVGASANSVIGVVAAYKRPALLRALLQSLAGNHCLRYVLVVDNGADIATQQVCTASPIPVRYERPAHNLGCGGGAAFGLKLGLGEPEVTHFCLFDDDARARPGAIDALLGGMLAVGADLGMPLVLDDPGYIAWYPGLQQARPWEVIRRARLTPEDYLRLCGPEPVPFTWAPWPVLALSTRSVRDCGFPRDDFWLCAEDIEYTLRLTHRYKGVLVPAAVCSHHPPSARPAAPAPKGAPADPNAVGGHHYLRFCLMLQNLSYIYSRLPHGRAGRRHWPGNFLRFFRTFGLRPATVADACRAVWRGMARGKPAGHAGVDGFKQRFLNLQSTKTSDESEDAAA